MVTIYYYVGAKRNILTARILLGRKRLFDKSTGISLKSKDEFDFESKRFVKNNTANKELSKFEAEIFTRAEEINIVYKGSTPPEDVFVKYLSGKVSLQKGEKIDETTLSLSNIAKLYKERSEAGLIFNKKTGKPLSPATIENNAYTSHMVELYLKAGGIDFDFSVYNNTTIAMLGRAVVKNKYNEFISSFKAYLNKQDLAENTMFKNMYRVKRMINYFMDSSGIDVAGLLDDLKHRKPSDREVVVLNEDQVEFVLKNYTKIREECKSILERNAFDYWYTALILNPRRTDMGLWTRDNLFSRDGDTWIKYIPNKTKNTSGRVVEAVVPTTLLNIFRRNIDQYHKLLPPLIHNLNLHIKRIARRYDVFRNEIQVLKKKKFVTIKTCDYIHIHMMRSTGMSHKLSSGWGESHVKEISGHTHDSESFKRYVKISADSKKRVANDYYKTMGL